MHGSTPRPCSFYLAPQEPSKMCGRSEFFIHGCQCGTSCDTTTPPCGDCSIGCIVCNLDIRKKLRTGDTLNVYNNAGEYFLAQLENRR